jgi:hypothetical protein
MNEPEFITDLVFLHLSDIHFRKGRMGDVHDVDADLRNELERDLRIVRTTRLTKLDGIIVSGDIAFSGQPEEFAYGRAWIEKIRELVDCPTTGIMVIPGNHDVDREVVQPSSVEDLHNRVRAAPSHVARDETIAAILRNGVEGPQLFSSIAAYNDFARLYGCAVAPDAPYWERDFPLSHGGTLRIRGMTSTLISGPRDHEDTHRVVYPSPLRCSQRPTSPHAAPSDVALFCPSDAARDRRRGDRMRRAAFRSWPIATDVDALTLRPLSGRKWIDGHSWPTATRLT